MILGKVEKSQFISDRSTGTGKTHMAKQIAQVLDVPLLLLMLQV